MKAARIQVLAVYAVVFVLGHWASGQQGEAERLITEAAGSAAGTTGVLQVNARLPESISGGANGVRLMVGDATSKNSAVISIQ
jgi:hypothetical protein